MASTKKRSKESIKEYAIIAIGVLLILEIMVYTCVATSPNRDKSLEGPLSMIDESETSFTDPGNSAVHENKEPGDEKNKEVEGKVGTSIPVVQLDDGMDAGHTSTRLDMNAPDEHSNSSFTEEEKETYDVTDQTQYIIDMLRKVCSEESDTLEEMKGAVCLACEFVKKNVEDLLDIRKKYDECRCAYNLDREKIDVLKEKIETYYRNTNNITRIPEGQDIEYETEMKEIDTLYEKICNVKKDKERAFNEYEKASMREIDLGNKSNGSRENILKYYSYMAKVEKKLISTIECDLELFKITCARNQLQVSVREKEKCHYQKDENKTELLDEILKLHESCIEHLYNGINNLEDMLSIQDDALYIAEEVYSEYKAYYMVRCMYKKEKKLRKYISSGFQFPLETQA